MPSETAISAALTALAPRLQAFRAAVSDAAERVDRFVAAATTDFPRQRVAAELGAFAANRIDAERFAGLLVGAPALDQAQRSVLTLAGVSLRELASAPDAQFVVDVPSGSSPGALIAERLATLGRAFAAAEAAELVRSHRHDATAPLPRGLPHARWNRAERAVAPPVVVLVDGADLWAAEAAPFLDGRQAIVFLVRGACPPAPLARLITPSVFVLQTSKPEALAGARGADASGPMVIALVPQGCAEFVHTPGNAPVHDRLSVVVAPEVPRRAIGAWSPRQQQDDLQLLLELATPGVARPKPIPGAPSMNGGDPVEQLAGWLLSQAAG